MQRQTLTDRRSSVIWLFIFLALIAVAIASYFYTVVGPRQQLAAQSEATAVARANDAAVTAQAEQTEIERLYAAGVALQQAGDWAGAAESLRQVISRGPGYGDAAQRLGEVLARMEQEKTQATAVVVALAATTQAGEAATATATATAQSKATAQAAADATETAAPSATAQALESRYQRALGLIGLQRWAEAEAVLNELFDADPGYKDVQTQLATVAAQTAKLSPTATPTASSTPTNTPTATRPPTPLPSATPTPDLRHTVTETATPTPSRTATVPPTDTRLPDRTATAAAATVIAFNSRTPTPTFTPTATPNATSTVLFVTAQAIATQEAATVTAVFATAQAIATLDAVAATAKAVAPQAERLLTTTGMEFVYVSAGEFVMGSPNGEGRDDERPQHTVTLDGYWIGKTEVTNAQYARCVEAGGCPAPDNRVWDDSSFAQHPVTDVSWENAVAYARWLTEQSGVTLRLPTEAEWEKAARGTDGRRYPWGNADPKDRLLNYNNNVGGTTVVGSYPAGASPYGALDMAGNVWEWVGDWYDASYYARSPARNPTGPESGEHRVLRGGSFNNNRNFARYAYRVRNNPDNRDRLYGFRLFSPGS